MPRLVVQPAERFWKKVNKDGPQILDTKCWAWTGALNNWNCARFWIYGRTVVYASRFSWELHYGSIPEGLFVCHHCDNPSCVNPEHLFLGTCKDNRDDMIRKGRGAWQTRDWGKFLKRARRKKAA